MPRVHGATKKRRIAKRDRKRVIRARVATANTPRRDSRPAMTSPLYRSDGDES